MIIKRIKNGKKLVQTTYEEFEKSKTLPSKQKKKRIISPIQKPVVNKPVKKPRKRRGCGCGK